MIAIQIGVIIFLVFILAIVYYDEHRRRKLGRKSAKLSSFWNRNKGGKERRKSVRINAEIDVSYELLSGSAAQKHNLMSRNISMGGINLALNEKLPPGTTLHLKLNVPQNPRPLFTEGKIVWVREVSGRFTRQKEERFFATGIQFIRIKPEDEAVLHSFIQQRARKLPSAITRGVK